MYPYVCHTKANLLLFRNEHRLVDGQAAAVRLIYVPLVAADEQTIALL